MLIDQQPTEIQTTKFRQLAASPRPGAQYYAVFRFFYRYREAVTSEALWKSHGNLALKFDAPPMMRTDDSKIATAKRSLSFTPSPEPTTKKMRLEDGKLGNALVEKKSLL